MRDGASTVRIDNTGDGTHDEAHSTACVQPKDTIRYTHEIVPIARVVTLSARSLTCVQAIVKEKNTLGSVNNVALCIRYL